MASRNRWVPVMGAVLLGLGTVAGLPPMLWGQTPSSQPAEAVLTVQDCDSIELGFGTCQWLHPLDAPKKKLLWEPKYRSAKPIYYAAVFGDAPDNTFTLVIDESAGTGKGYDTLYVDLNNDNRLDGPKETVRFPTSTTSAERPVRVKFMVKVGQATVPYWVNFTAFAYKDEKTGVENMHANLREAAYRKGQAVIAGKMHRIALADLNSNGLFNDPETGGMFTGDRFFVDLNDDGKFDGKDSESEESGFPLGRYTKIGGQWYTIEARPDGQAVKITAASPPLGQVQASPMVVEALLTSPQQGGDLRFKDGKAEAVAGEYRILWARLVVQDKAGKAWRLTARWGAEGTPVKVPSGGSVALPIPDPSLEAVPTVACSGEDLMIGIRLSGMDGARLSWPQTKGDPAKPGYEIHDAQGHTAASGTFEWG